MALSIFCAASEAGDHDRAGDFSGKLQPEPDSADCCIQLGGDGPECRAKVIHLNAQPFIENCMIQGYSRKHIILRHILPNLYDVLLSRFLLGSTAAL